ncbi:LOW QUALITY PROTEIN: prefoldin subunit 5 [Phaethornis superciliosus]
MEENLLNQPGLGGLGMDGLDQTGLLELGEGEMEFLLSSITQLLVHTKYVEAEDWKDLLVPLTSSMYIPGKLLHIKHILIDAGTGYCMKKVRIEHCQIWRGGSVPFLEICSPFFLPPFPFSQSTDNTDYFKWKIDFLTKQMEKMQPVLQERHSMK